MRVNEEDGVGRDWSMEVYVVEMVWGKWRLKLRVKEDEGGGDEREMDS